MSTLDVMPFDTADYLADTQHLTLAQHGAYFLILLTMWRHAAWIDDDEIKLARICKTTIDKWRKIRPEIMALLILNDGKLSQKRLLAEYEAEIQKRVQLRRNLDSGSSSKSLKNKDTTVTNGETDKNHPSLFEESKKEESKTESGRKRQIPLDSEWTLPPPWRLWARQQGVSDTEINSDAARFSAHWRSTGERKADWYATWQKWILNEIKWAKQREQRKHGYGGSRTLQDDSKSVSGAAARLQDAIRNGGAVRFPPRPRLDAVPCTDDRRLLPKG